MRSLGKLHIGNNQAGKGDARRPESDILNEKLFKTDGDAAKFSLEMGPGTHCFVCGDRIYRSITYSKFGKTLIIGQCCKFKIYNR